MGTWNDSKQAQSILTIMENGNMIPPEVLREFVHGRWQAGKGTAKFPEELDGAANEADAEWKADDNSWGAAGNNEGAEQWEEQSSGDHGSKRPAVAAETAPAAKQVKTAQPAKPTATAALST